MKKLTGRCLCGAIEYSIPDSLKYSGFCHCSDCRKFSGSSFSVVGGIPAEDLRVTKGKENIATYAKSEDTVLAFCRICGSSLYAEKPKKNLINLRLGTLDQAPSLTPQFHSFVGSKAAWDHIYDDLPRFEAGRQAGFGSPAGDGSATHHE